MMLGYLDLTAERGLVYHAAKGDFYTECTVSFVLKDSTFPVARFNTNQNRNVWSFEAMVRVVSYSAVF